MLSEWALKLFKIVALVDESIQQVIGRDRNTSHLLLPVPSLAVPPTLMSLLYTSRA